VKPIHLIFALALPLTVGGSALSIVAAARHQPALFHWGRLALLIGVGVASLPVVALSVYLVGARIKRALCPSQGKQK